LCCQISVRTTVKYKLNKVNIAFDINYFLQYHKPNKTHHLAQSARLFLEIRESARVWRSCYRLSLREIPSLWSAYLAYYAVLFAEMYGQPVCVYCVGRPPVYCIYINCVVPLTTKIVYFVRPRRRV